MQDTASHSAESEQDKRLGEPFLEITQMVQDFNT